MGCHHVLQSSKDKTGTGLKTMIVLFCLLCVPVGNPQNPQEPGPCLRELRKNRTGELTERTGEIYTLRSTHLLGGFL